MARFETVIERFNAHHTGAGWMARCPSHEDRSPSLSIAEGRDGRVLMHCFAGCAVEQVCAAAGFELRDLFAGPCDPQDLKPQIVRAMERENSDLRSSLTRWEREMGEVTVILTDLENLDIAICRGLALAIEDELVQIVLKERHP
jgi:putative DNA primase/helicase